MDKPTWIAVTDEAEIEELTSRKGELDTPMLYAPNGQLWAVAEQYRAWKDSKQGTV